MLRHSFNENTELGGSAQSSMKELLEEYSFVEAPTNAQKIRGEIIAESKKGYWVAYGGKSDAFAPAGSFGNENLKIGERLLFEVLKEDDGVAILSRDGGREWDELLCAKQNGDILKLKVSRILRAEGKITRVIVRYSKKVSGIIPFSLLGIRPDQADSLLNQEIEVKVEDAVPQSNRLILNRRAVEDERRTEQEKAREEFISSVRPGTVFKQVPVCAIATKQGNEFGIFIKIGQVKGLVFHTELPRDAVRTSLSKSYQIGQLVDVMVMPARESNGRKEIALSMKAVQAQKKREFFANHNVGDLLEAKLARKVSYGIFATLSEEADVDGLLYCKQYPDSGEPELGGTVTVRIVSLDKQRCLVGISMRDIQAQ